MSLPSILDYLPHHAEGIFKLAEEPVREPPSNSPASPPGPAKKPLHPYLRWAGRQAGYAGSFMLGGLAGIGATKLLEEKGGVPLPDMIRYGAPAVSAASLLAHKMWREHEAEAERRANEEWANRP